MRLLSLSACVCVCLSLSQSAVLSYSLSRSLSLSLYFCLSTRVLIHSLPACSLSISLPVSHILPSLGSAIFPTSASIPSACPCVCPCICACVCVCVCSCACLYACWQQSIDSMSRHLHTVAGVDRSINNYAFILELICPSFHHISISPLINRSI